MFILSFNVAPYFQLQKTCFFHLISERFWINMLFLFWLSAHE